MNKKLTKIISTIIPNKKINFFMFFIITLGIISGSIFMVLLNPNDKVTVTTQITNFMSNINDNNINMVQAFKNSLSINFTYVFLIWILGMSIIGIIFNIFLVYIKGFVIGFSISSLIYVYGVKGILGSIIYVFPHQILNLMIVLILGIYSVMFTIHLYNVILGNRNTGIRTFLIKYLYILIIACVVSLVTTFFEILLTPALFKLIIKLFV